MKSTQWVHLKWLNSVSIRNKLLLFLLVLTLSLLFFIYNSHKNEQQIQHKAELVDQHLHSVFSLSLLVTELQKERGLTMGYLQSSDKQQQLSKLNKQRQLTGERFVEFYQTLSEPPEETAYKTLTKTYDIFFSQREHLYQVSLEPKNSLATFEFYSQLITQSINLMLHLTKLVDDADLNHQMTTYMALIHLQEQAGQERGLLHGILQSQKINSTEFAVLTSINSNQNIYLTTFYNEAPIKYKKLVRDIFGHPRVTKVKKISVDVLNTFSRLELVNQIQQFIGYGGLIHLFKNYVVRGEQKLVEQFENKFEQLHQIFQNSQYLEIASDEEKNRFNQIIATIDVYHNMLPLVSFRHENHMAPKEIDKIVKVNDRMALDAIAELRARLTYEDVSTWWQDASFVVEQYVQVAHLFESDIEYYIKNMRLQAAQDFYLYLVIAVVIFLSSVFFAYILLSRLVRDVHQISKTMNAMTNGVNQKLPVDGNDEISQMSHSFNRLIEERSKTEQELKCALEEAQVGSKIKSEFLSNMSHEIRTPLNGVLGMAELISQTQLDEEQQEYTEIIERSGKLLLTIVNDILDFSKLDSGNVQLEQITFDLEKAGSDVIKLLSQQAHEKKLGLEFKYEQDAPHYFVGDPSRLQQIFINLINNAIKFTHNGHVVLEITPKKMGEVLYQVKISVNDTGIGIKEEHLAKLFDSFTQAEQSTTRKYGGTGLGLSISKQLVELMGGLLEVESVPGKGSCFYFSLTFVAVDTIDEARNSNLLSIGKDKVITDSIMNDISDEPIVVHQEQNTLASVLLAEDNIVNQKVALAVFKKLNLRVDVANDGVEAVKKCQEKSYDLTFMDCQMPNMDGLEATVEIRKNEQGVRMPIIALTANALPEDKERCQQVGMDDFIAKPFKKDDIARVLEQWLT
ncbi:MAG: response regulator [Gammaproteobacteria bacterium]|nr:response regulator [Gammaproteobacteria bacterium]